VLIHKDARGKSPAIESVNSFESATDGIQGTIVWTICGTLALLRKPKIDGERLDVKHSDLFNHLLKIVELDHGHHYEKTGARHPQARGARRMPSAFALATASVRLFTPNLP